MRLRHLAALTAIAICAATAAAAQTVVTTGVVIRGLSNGVRPVGVNPGDPVNPGMNCDFSREEVGQNGRMTGASVQCRAGGNLGNTMPGLAANFTAYCAATPPTRVGGRLITASIPRVNANHCDLSAVTPGAATTSFGGARWR